MKTTRIDGDLILERDAFFDGDLIVNGNIKGKNGQLFNLNALDITALDITARDIDAHDITARDVYARDVICETRRKKSENAKTICRIFVTEKSKLAVTEK